MKKIATALLSCALAAATLAGCAANAAQAPAGVSAAAGCGSDCHCGRIRQVP